MATHPTLGDGYDLNKEQMDRYDQLINMPIADLPHALQRRLNRLMSAPPRTLHDIAWWILQGEPD